MVMEQTLQDAAPSHPNRRKVGNFFLKPAYNLKFGYRLITAGFLCFGATAWLVWQKLGQFDALMNQNYADVSPVAAAEIMAQAAVPINDLHAVIETAGPQACVLDDGVHLNERGSSLLARAVAQVVRQHLRA